MAGKIQNEDVKTLTELTAAGGSVSQLINDTKIYVTGNSINKQLSQAIISGDIHTGTLGIAKGGTNATSYTAPSGTLCPITYYDGTKLATDTNVAHLGYDTATDTVYTGALNISHPTTATAKYTNTAASGPGAGGGMSGYSDDGAAMASGDRLAFYTFGGAKDASHTLQNASAITSFATENWGTSATGADLRVETTPNGSTTRTRRVTIGNDGHVALGASDPTTSAALDLQSTDGALLVPRLTTTQKNSLTATNGMIVYDTTLNQLHAYISGGWYSLGGGNVPNLAGQYVEITNLTTTAQTFTAPANAVGFVIESLTDNTNNIRYKIGSTATISSGMRLEPGRSEAYPNGPAANISVIAEAGTNQVISVQWILTA